MPKNAAAAHSGIHRITLFKWEQRGRDARAKREEGHALTVEEKAYEDFIDAFELAWDKGEFTLFSEGRECARDRKKGDWTFFITALERQRPKEWRRHMQTEHVGEGGKPFEIKFSFVENPDLVEKLREK